MLPTRTGKTASWDDLVRRRKRHKVETRAHLSHRCLIADLSYEMADEIEGLALAGDDRGSQEH
jgi:hypothetical protein